MKSMDPTVSRQVQKIMINPEHTTVTWKIPRSPALRYVTHPNGGLLVEIEGARFKEISAFLSAALDAAKAHVELPDAQIPPADLRDAPYDEHQHIYVPTLYGVRYLPHLDESLSIEFNSGMETAIGQMFGVIFKNITPLMKKPPPEALGSVEEAAEKYQRIVENQKHAATVRAQGLAETPLVAHTLEEEKPESAEPPLDIAAELVPANSERYVQSEKTPVSTRYEAFVAETAHELLTQKKQSEEKKENHQ